MLRALLGRLVLALAPREFRARYGEQIRMDLEANADAGALADVAWAGMVMRLEFLAHDLRTALHALLRAPLITVVAVITLALAVAANFIVAAMVQGFFFRALPFPNAGQLLFVQETDVGRAMTYADGLRLANAIPDLQLALADPQRAVLAGTAARTLVQGALVSPNYFDVLGVKPALGHFFSGAGANAQSVVISYDVWQERFGGDPSALGSAITLGLHAYQIVGVAPRDFHDPTPYGFVQRSYWLPASALSTNGAIAFNGIARVHDGVSPRALMPSIRDRLSAIVRSEPGAFGGTCCVAVTSAAERLSGPMRPLLLLLYAFVTVVIVIAFFNVANLNLGRIAARAGDLSVRVALGASPQRIASELTIEALLQAVAGSAIGLGVAYTVLQRISAIAAPYLPQMRHLGLDGALAGYALLVVAVTTLLTGTLPAMQRGDRAVAASLKDVGRADDGRKARKTLARLVIAEVAMASALVTAAGVILLTVIATTHVNLGFDPANLYLAQITLPDDGSIATQDERRYVERTLSALQSNFPGGTVAASSEVPLNCCSTIPVRLQPGAQPLEMLYNVVSPGYFDTLRIPVLLGRAFTANDTQSAPCVAVVDRSFARQYYGASDPIGRTLQPQVSGIPAQCEIVGMVGSVPQAYGQAQRPMLYLTTAQAVDFAQFVIRALPGQRDVAATVQRAIGAGDPLFPNPTVISYATMMREQLMVPWISAIVFGALSLIALVVALSGVYALTAYSVARQTREFGIRSAIGASPLEILRHVCREALQRSALGAGFGVVIVALISFPLRFVLYGSTAGGMLLVFAAVAAIVLAFTFAAALIPAMRAARVAPAAALRQD